MQLPSITEKDCLNKISFIRLQTSFEQFVTLTEAKSFNLANQSNILYNAIRRNLKNKLTTQNLKLLFDKLDKNQIIPYCKKQLNRMKAVGVETDAEREGTTLDDNVYFVQTRRQYIKFKFYAEKAQTANGQEDTDKDERSTVKSNIY
ncbi:Hypothetical_protein [Hexamita inflata]|uniref:Hypothetical_protein n=1 Tax=Hexamita inflata TaxID=28002 RepID=A0ABP1HE07_9EUKA